MAEQISFNEVMRAQGYEYGLKYYCAILGLTTIAGIALFIIGCIGVARAFPGPSIGWVTVGLGSGVFVLDLAFGNFKERKLGLIALVFRTAALVTSGILGGIGIMPANEVGLAIIGTSLSALPIGLYTLHITAEKSTSTYEFLRQQKKLDSPISF